MATQKALWVISLLLLTTGQSEKTPRLRRDLSDQPAEGHQLATLDTAEERLSNGLSGLMESLLVKRSREKRSKDNKFITGFSASERAAIVDLHNEYRRSVRPPAADMQMMNWNDELETMANNFAARCVFEHNANRDSGTFTSVGENIYAHSSSYNESEVVEHWHSEEKNYDYDSNTCSAVCGHYTQVVWATSNKVGCGIRYCDPLNKVSFGKGYFVVCNYAPSGNIAGMRPYQRATVATITTQAPATTTKSRDTVDTEDDGNAACAVHTNILLLAATIYFFLCL